MGNLLKLAFRNVFRFKRRSFIALTSISIGLCLLIVSIALMNGIDKQSITNLVDSQTSHIKIFSQGYYEKRDEFPLDINIKNPERIRSILNNLERIKGTESRILFGAGLIRGMDELPCLGVAIQPGQDQVLFDIKDSLITGEWLTADDEQMLVGVDLASDIGLAVGDILTVRMIYTTEGGEFGWNAVDLPIKGIFDTGNPAVDSQRIFVPFEKAQEWLSQGQEASEIVVRLNLTLGDDKTLTEVKKQIETVLRQEEENVEVYSWKDLAGTFLAISKMKTKNSATIVMIMLVIAAMGIINTMLMAVLERTREIGMMAALGMKKREIMQLFIYEGAFLGIFGSLLGCLFGGLLSWRLEVKGWSIAPFGESYEKMAAAFYPVKDVFYADLTFDVLLMTFLFGLGIAVLSSLYPARRAARLKPVEALRHI